MATKTAPKTDRWCRPAQLAGNGAEPAGFL